MPQALTGAPVGNAEARGIHRAAHREQRTQNTRGRTCTMALRHNVASKYRTNALAVRRKHAGHFRLLQSWRSLAPCNEPKYIVHNNIHQLSTVPERPGQSRILLCCFLSRTEGKFNQGNVSENVHYCLANRLINSDTCIDNYETDTTYCNYVCSFQIETFECNFQSSYIYVSEVGITCSLDDGASLKATASCLRNL